MKYEQALGALGLNLEGKCQLLFGKEPKLTIVFVKIKDAVHKRCWLQIKEFWEEWIKTHLNDLDEPVASVMSIVSNGNGVTIRVRKKYFSGHVQGSATRPPKIGFSTGNWDSGIVLALSIGAIAVTLPSENYPDGCIIFSKRKQTAFNCGEYTMLPSGYVQPEKDYVKRGEEKFIQVKKTLEQERKGELPGLECYEEPKVLGLIYNCVGSRQPMLVMSVNFLYTTEEAEQILNAQKPDWEVDGYVFVPADIQSLKVFAKNNPVCFDALCRMALWVADNY